MTKWPDNPVYTPLSEINKGNEYEPADGIVAKDINAFIENVDYLNKTMTNSLSLLEAKLNENIVKDPEKTYLVWKGNTFPNSSAATFKAPAGSTIDWGDGIVETFTTASTVVNTHTYTDDIKYHLISISGLSSLPYSSFFGCVNLIEVVLGEGVSQIGDTVFRRCENLKKVVCGHHLQSIGIESFDYGTIIINNKYITPSINKNNFYNTEKIIVPKSMINAYKSAADWSQYADKIVYEVDSSDIPDTSKFAKLDEENTFTQKQHLPMAGMTVGTIGGNNPAAEYDYCSITGYDPTTKTSERFYLPLDMWKSMDNVLALQKDIPDTSNLSTFSVEVW